MATEFVKVRDGDGREADITEAEVASYRAMGFEPVPGTANDGAGNSPAAVSSTDQKLDLVLDELRGLRADLAGKQPAEPVDGDTIQLREPGGEPATKNAEPEAPAKPADKTADAKAADAKATDKK